MNRRVVLTAALGVFGLASMGCKAGTAKPAAAAPRSAAATCEHIGGHVLAFGEAVDDAGAAAKGRLSSYAGLLELLVSFERASADLETELAAVSPVEAKLADALTRSIASLRRARRFAGGEREAIERHAREVAPLALEAQDAWTALRSACRGKNVSADCAALREIVARYDAADTTAAHVRVVDQLSSARVAPPLGRARDRAVAASRGVQRVIAARTQAASAMPRKWAMVRKDVEDAIEGLARPCKGTTVDRSPRFVEAERPDPRKLTVLVKVRPPAKVEKTFVELATATKNDEERAFYEARARGAFGSGFIIVRKAPRAGTDAANEVLVVTNRHVVDLGDRAALELADGSSLGAAEIVYTDPTRDVAILRATSSLPIVQGFSFATGPAKDQQVVIATGFPGLVGRPSYQTTRGYVSNESFRLEETPAGSLTYVQHTAPIDPGSSGGPLTDEAGHVLGVNTLKVSNREAVGLAVPSSAILDAMRRAESVELRAASPDHRREGVRLACLGFIAELAMAEPRMTVLEAMISNTLTGAEGLSAAKALEGDDAFDRVWEADSVRAMRIATLVRIRAAFLAGGGPSVLETCSEANAGDLEGIMTAPSIRYRVRLANFETRQIAFRWEQGHWKLASFDASGRAATTKPRRATKKPTTKKKAAPRGRSAGQK